MSHYVIWMLVYSDNSPVGLTDKDSVFLPLCNALTRLTCCTGHVITNIRDHEVREKGRVRALSVSGRSLTVCAFGESALYLYDPI